ncbi:MAG: hypothetical protein LC721_01305, partial [Actinobacteria bacterium]|nr:hypothetical protein [Actinomycetota bacterium]
MSNTITINWHAHARVLKYTPAQVEEFEHFLGRKAVQADFEAHGVDPRAITEADGNLLTTAGLNRITALIINSGGLQAFSNTRAAVGVGDSATAATVTDAALGGNSATHSWWMQADASNPTQSNGVITCNATFNDNNSQFAWNEWGFGIATAAITPNAVFGTATTT